MSKLRELHDSGKLTPSDLRIDARKVVDELKGVEDLRLPFFEMCGRGSDSKVIESILNAFCESDVVPNVETALREAIEEGHVQVVGLLSGIIDKQNDEWSEKDKSRLSELVSWSSDVTVCDSPSEITANLLAAGIEQLPLHTQLCGSRCVVLSMDSMLPDTLTDLDTLTVLHEGEELLYSTKCLIRS
eukprot:TRINITY_DN34699_c0_g1_i1.p1 TRINITY_DN34699_c0_g1~~TRINITY_DN34699_c0_g1_i1.p1  ORF type:complete len:187 (+),score=35.75 TRINITY_DN34699_c0_g1_i1:61-621(+)